MFEDGEVFEDGKIAVLLLLYVLVENCAEVFKLFAFDKRLRILWVFEILKTLVDAAKLQKI